MNQKSLLSVLLLALFVLCASASQEIVTESVETLNQSNDESESSSNNAFLQMETSSKGLNLEARTKDQFASTACQNACIGIGGYPCGKVAYACCYNKDSCESGWISKKCLRVIHSFSC